MSSSTTPSILVTGAGGGLGGATARLFLERGWTVFAADLHAPSGLEGARPLTVDVTSTPSVEQAVQQVSGQVERLDAVVNFAGVLDVGTPLVELDPERFRRTMEVNLHGTFLVNRLFFPLLKAPGGRIVNISSEAGRNSAMPCSAPYSISKHAVEAYSDALRRELAVVGVDVVIVQPGAFRTSMTGAIEDLFRSGRREGSPFAPLVQNIGEAATGTDAAARDPRVLAEAVWHATTTATPKQRYAVHHDRKGVLVDKLPSPLLDRLLRATLHKA